MDSPRHIDLPSQATPGSCIYLQPLGNLNLQFQAPSIRGSAGCLNHNVRMQKSHVAERGGWGDQEIVRYSVVPKNHLAGKRPGKNA